MTPHPEFVEVNGVRLFTRTLGEGPDVLVLHGGPGAHHDYLLPYFDQLATGRRLRYYDQRGGGQSAVGRDVATGWREHVADLEALVNFWGLGPAPLLGDSWGGLLAMLYAIAHPASAGRLALVSPAAATAAGRAEFERRFAERVNDPRILAERDRLNQSDFKTRDPEAYRRRAFELSVAPYFRNPERARDLTAFRVTGRTQDAAWRSLGDYDIRPQVAALSVPAIVIQGRHDPIPLESGAEIARLLRAPFVVFEHSGHVPYVEETERLVSVLDDFLPRTA